MSYQLLDLWCLNIWKLSQNYRSRLKSAYSSKPDEPQHVNVHLLNLIAFQSDSDQINWQRVQMFWQKVGPDYP